jgi:DNA (cytosine-5)-methyltransferase 1
VIYGSVCSGIETATLAWQALGWTPSFFSEIDKFPRAVLQHHFPDVPLHGDFTTIGADDYDPVDLLVGGTPCQDFSLAGLRKGLDGDRGVLALDFLRLLKIKRPRWVVWENVPGVLSNDGGRTLGAILGGLVECGYGFAYRVLDAQHFGVPQRRRRVFVVGCLGDYRRAAAVLLERESLRGDSAPSREKGTQIARSVTTHSGGASGKERQETFIIAEKHGVFDPNQITSKTNRSNPTPAPVMYSIMPQNSGKDYKARAVDVSQPLMGSGLTTGNQGGDYLLSFTANDYGADAEDNLAPPVRAGMHDKGKPNGGVPPAVAFSTGVRRLMPIECERLQGIPDNFTKIPWRKKAAEDCPDGPRYRAIGNAMPVPVMRWLGERIQMVEGIG